MHDFRNSGRSRSLANRTKALLIVLNVTTQGLLQSLGMTRAHDHPTLQLSERRLRKNHQEISNELFRCMGDNSHIAVITLLHLIIGLDCDLDLVFSFVLIVHALLQIFAISDVAVWRASGERSTENESLSSNQTLSQSSRERQSPLLISGWLVAERRYS